MFRKESRRWRLRHKLGASLAVAAVLPVVVATWVAVSVIIGGLEDGLRQETDRQLRVGLNLLIKNIKGLGSDAVSVASYGELIRSLETDVGILGALQRAADTLPTSVVQVTNRSGKIIARRDNRGPRASGFVDARADDPSIQAALQFERRVTIVPQKDRLIVRAAAPVVNRSFDLVGTVVVSMPLDGRFLDNLKAAVGAEIAIYSSKRNTNPSGTFVDDNGRRMVAPPLSAGVVKKVYSLKQAFGTVAFGERSYSGGFEPILDFEGNLVGVFSAAVDRAPLTRARGAAARSLAIGGAGALLFALGVAALLSRRIANPLQRLHRGAVAIAQGDLEQRIESKDQNDEIGELASAFSKMTEALKENRRRLAARMREIVALHDAGRAVSSVLDLEDVLRKIVDEVSKVLHANVCALWLVPSQEETQTQTKLELGAARVVVPGIRRVLRGADAIAEVSPLAAVAERVAETHASVRMANVEDSLPAEQRTTALANGALLGVPVELKGRTVGVILTGRGGTGRPFTLSDSHLLSTFADQAASAVENARQYAREKSFNEKLEEKVKQRTNELTLTNDRLAKTVDQLNDTQTQLILSEKLANLGVLVAGVAHEINSPSAAIQGTAQGLSNSVSQHAALSGEMMSLSFVDGGRDRFLALVERATEVSGEVRSPVEARNVSREFMSRLEKNGVRSNVASSLGSELANFNADQLVHELIDVIETQLAEDEPDRAAMILVALFTESVFMRRASSTIETAVGRIQRIVRSLKSYSRMDGETNKVATDLHEGLESTIVLLEHMFSRGVRVQRDYGKLPTVVACADELNQVWTNLIHNAVQAVGGEGEIAIRTREEDNGVVVAVTDDGPGIPEDVLPRVFEPFYTTKKKGEGTGLGLQISKQIVDRHQGRISVTSSPGKTVFSVWLPLVQSPVSESLGVNV